MHESLLIFVIPKNDRRFTSVRGNFAQISLQAASRRCYFTRSHRKSGKQREIEIGRNRNRGNWLDNFKERRPGLPKRNILMEDPICQDYDQKWRAANQMTKRLFRWILFFSVSRELRLYVHRAWNPNRQSCPQSVCFSFALSLSLQHRDYFFYFFF